MQSSGRGGAGALDSQEAGLRGRGGGRDFTQTCNPRKESKRPTKAFGDLWLQKTRLAPRSSNSKFRSEVERGCFLLLTGTVRDRQDARSALKNPLSSAAASMSPTTDKGA